MYGVLSYNENRKLLVAFDIEIYMYIRTFYAAKAHGLRAMRQKILLRHVYLMQKIQIF